MNILLKDIDVGSLFTVIGLTAGIALIFALLIVLVYRFCAVKTDEKAEAIKDNLAGANCGGCGYAGCADFAKALSEGKADLSGCGATSNEGKQRIASILGIPFSASEQTFAVVHCNGGVNAKDKYIYCGNDGCEAINSKLNGNKQCSFGCLGGGTCKDVCPYGAVSIKDGVSIVDKSVCRACCACVKNCPKNIIGQIPKRAKVYVACSNKCKGKEVMDACKNGCIGCGLCAKNCEVGAITMIDNVPEIDYSKCIGCKTCVIKCPRKCIKEL